MSRKAQGKGFKREQKRMNWFVRGARKIASHVSGWNRNGFGRKRF